MARVFYERLSDESAAYLDNESSRQREHTAMILLFESGPLATKEGGVDYARIRKIVEARLPELPRLRAKLRRVPVEGHPVWVDDREFNLDYHLRQSGLPRPGTMQQLGRTAARIAATRLDRSRPLWDCWVIEGVEGGRFALVLKMHKALAHLEGADLFRALLSDEEGARTPEPGRCLARPAPSPVELFRSEVLGRWSPSRRLVGRTLEWVAHPARAQRRARRRAESVLKLMGYRLRPAGESPFDGNLGPHRAFAFTSVDLEAAQAIRQTLGGTVHDAVLSILTGALRRVVEARRIHPESVDLRAITPVLSASEEDAFAFTVELPVWEEKPSARQDVLTQQTRRLAEEADVAPAASLVGAGEWNAARLFAIGARALKTIENGHLAILQSPGPRDTLYLDGAPLTQAFGILPLQDSAGLGITVLSYAGRLFFAFNTDPDILQDVQGIADAVDEEAAALLEAVSRQGRPLRAVAAG